MKKIYTLLLISIVKMSFASSGHTWWKEAAHQQASNTGKQLIATSECRVMSLDLSELRSYLLTAPMEFTSEASTKKVVLEVPMPDGSYQNFRIVESPVCAPELAAKFPETKTWSGQGLDDLTATIRFDITPFGFHAMILSANGDVFIDPYNRETSEFYIVYSKSKCIRTSQGACEFDPEETWNKQQAEMIRNLGLNHEEARSSGNVLRTYSLALACTGEYAATYGGTVSGAHAGMVTSVNRVTGVYEKELSIRLQLVANNDTLIFTNAASDPYTNNSGGTMLGENQTTVTARIGSANYDIGHVFSTGGGGIAGLGVVCTSSQKARGVTGSSSPVGDPFDIDYVAHEMGHQFGGNHTFNSVSGACFGNRNGSTAYEPGSGITIMGYAGICGGDDLASHSIAYFHTISYDEIQDYTETGNGSICPTNTSTGNDAPVSALVNYQYNVPVSTPFILTGAGSDPNNDTITYSWEEFDLGPSGTWNSVSGNAPIFMSVTPTLLPYRIFPKLLNVYNNVDTKGEKKASYARTLKFRMTLRDNRNNGGGVSYDDVLTEVNVIGTTPFAITYPNTTGITWVAGTSQTITWDVAGTTNSPINASNVNIYLSTNSGPVYPFPILIASNVPNNGSYTFTVPNNVTSTARILIEGAGNIFFDINDKNFTIAPSTGISEKLNLENVNLIPNPAHTDVQLVLSGPLRGNIEARIYDLSGRVVLSESANKNQEGLIIRFDISKLSAGFYNVTLETSEGKINRKLNIE